jgi:hypothetical protein
MQRECLPGQCKARANFQFGGVELSCSHAKSAKQHIPIVGRTIEHEDSAGAMSGNRVYPRSGVVRKAESDSPYHLVRPRQHVRANRQADLLRRLKVND